MDESSPVMDIRLPSGVATQTRAVLRSPARPVLVYDPAHRLPAGRDGSFARTAAIWLCAATLGAVVGETVALKNPLAYAATGLLPSVGIDETAQDEPAIITSGEVMQGVADQVGSLRVAPGCAVRKPQDPACPARMVKAQLHVQTIGKPNGTSTGSMLRLTAIHADPAIAVAMLDAAVAMDRTIWHAANPADRADALAPQLAAAQNALDQTSTEMANIRAQAHVTDIARDVAQAAAAANAAARLGADLRLRQAAVSAELKAAQTALQTVPETVLDSREVSSGDPGQDSRALLLQLKLQRAHMAELYAHDYPGIAELDHKIQTVEAAMKAQAKTVTFVTRDIRNPVLTPLALATATLGSESAGLVQQQQEMQRQLDGAVATEASLRGTEQRLSGLQQRQATQEATVRQLTLSVANLRAQDLLNADRLARRHLLQRPVATAVPWTGTQPAAAAGAASGLLCGLVLSLIARRRRHDPAPQAVLKPDTAPASLSLPAAPENAAPVPRLAFEQQRAIESLRFYPLSLPGGGGSETSGG